MIAFWKCNYPVHQTIFKPVTDLFISLFNDKNTITLYQYKDLETKSIEDLKKTFTIKVINIGLNSDKGMREEVFGIKVSGYVSCGNCISPGVYSDGAVHFPQGKYSWARRSEKIATICNFIREKLNQKSYGGHCSISEWQNIGHFDLFLCLIINDPMHDFVGIITVIIKFLGEDMLEKLKQFDIKLTKETMGHYGKILIFLI